MSCPTPNWEQSPPSVFLRAGAAELLLQNLSHSRAHDAALSPVPGFIIDGELGRGGTAIVYRAFRLAMPDQALALKVFSQRCGLADSSRVWRELELMRDLRLDCVPTLVDFGIHEEHLYLASLLIPGQTLLEQVQQQSLSTRERVELLTQVADTVQRLHEHGIVHRDIKPTNVMVDDCGRIVLLDLGLARLVDGGHVQETLTTTGTPIGTPAYMSPEQARGQRLITTRTDIWALGAIGYMLLTGNTPHDLSTPLHDIVRRVAQEPARRVHALNSELPLPLTRILERACAFSPEHRYASARDLAEDLRRWLNGQPVNAGGSSLWVRASGWIGRHPALATAGAFMLTFCVGAAVSVAWWTLVGLQPSQIAYERDRTGAVLQNKGGQVTRKWVDGQPGSVVLADLVTAPTLDDRQVIVLAFNRQGPASHAGKVQILDAANPDRVVLEVRPDDPSFVIPHRRTLEARAQAATDSLTTPAASVETNNFIPADALFADVFPDEQGTELVVRWRHSDSGVDCIRVFALDGRRLMECWHWGRLANVHWMEGPGLLLCGGVTNRADYKQAIAEHRGPTSGRYAGVVFAIRPQKGAFGWIEPSVLAGDRDGTGLAPEWYRVLQPWSAHRGVDSATVWPSRLALGSHWLASVSLQGPAGGIYFEAEKDGTITPQFPNDAYIESENAGLAEPWTLARWVEEQDVKILDRDPAQGGEVR